MIHRANRPIRKWDPTHPARAFLELHAAFKAEVVAFELRAPDCDVVWESPLTGRPKKLSDALYGDLSFTPILTEWIEARPTRSANEQRHLDRIAACRVELDSAERRAEGNDGALAIIRRTRAVLDAWERCIREREVEA